MSSQGCEVVAVLRGKKNAGLPAIYLQECGGFWYAWLFGGGKWTLLGQFDSEERALKEGRAKAGDPAC